MNTKTGWRWLSLLIVITMLLALIPGFSSAQESTAPPAKEQPARTAHSGLTPAEAAPKAAAPRRYSRPADYLDKLHPDLQALLAVTGPALPAEYGERIGAAADEPIAIEIIASADLKPGMAESALVDRLRPYFVDGQLYTQPAFARVSGNLQMLFGRILPSNLAKVASLGSVLRIYPIKAERVEYDVIPADDPKPEVKPGPEEWAQLRANAEKLREGSLPWSEAKAFGDGREAPPTEDWFEVLPEGPAKAQSAWDRGYDGDGIIVAVDDDGVDFGHPDLMGTQKIYEGAWSQDPGQDSPYNGWPYAMDPFTMRAYAYEVLGLTSYISDGFEGVTYFDTSATPSLSPCASGTYCFEYAPLLGFGVPGTSHTYVVDAGMTQSGVLHVGTHNDGSLRDYVWGERVAVLVGDPNVPGVYDTVWVDLDDDYDFRDEKPVTKADPSNPATYNNPISYRDMNGDGKADLNGGLLYFIADGVNYIPGSDWLWDGLIPPPGNGDLIAMHGPWDSGYSHGTNCASNVVAQGAIDGALPSFRDLPPGPGVPTAAVYGMAPGAKLLAMNDAWRFTGSSNTLDGYMFLAFGWDATDQTGFNWFFGPGYVDGDAVAASSHSYGYSDEFNDGWDYDGQFVSSVQKDFAPYLQFLYSTGNGGPGYGTVAPPSPALGIGVGASTEYGSTGWDTITDTEQINFNDIAAFSNSGPSARAGAGVDVVAGGAFAAGSEELNYFSPSTWGVLDGNLSWDTWGGTSRSAPVTLGIYALMADAYLDAHGVLPTHEQGKALLMSAASDINYDVFKQGAGAVNGDTVTQIASGEYGVYMDAGSATWEPGDYRGDDWPAFGHLVYPGDGWNKDFTVRNDGPSAIDVQISDSYMELIGSEELELTVTADMVAQENADNFYKAFHYFIPLTAAVGFEGADPDWYNVAIPAETDLMVVRQIFPFEEFDYDGDYIWDNRFYLTIYNWTDENGDGNVWEDKNANGVVNFLNDPMPSDILAGPELLWNDPANELDRWEYGRFGYNRPYANTAELGVRDPLERMRDGLFIGLYHNPGSIYPGDTHLKYRVEFYKRSDVDWLSTDVNVLNVPAGGTATFQGTVNVPANMPAGDYAAAIEILDPGPLGGEPNNIVVPVVMNVASGFSNGLTLGGTEAYNHDADTAYNNGAVRGYFDWGWREESGDWRSFYMDVDNQAVETPVWSEDLEGTFPPTGWGAYDLTGNGAWLHDDTRSVSPTHSAYHADDTGAQDAWLVTPQFTPASDSTEFTFWQSDNWSSYYGYHGIWVSEGSGDPSVGDFHELAELGPAVEDAWEQVRLSLAAYVGTPIYVAFVYGGDYSDQWWIDDVAVVEATYPFPPDAHVMVKDEWQGPAPATDIDTIILNPTPSGLSNAGFGAWSADLSDSGFFGPYTLNTVMQSVDDRAGQSIWRFNTTSGGNEEWLMFPIEDGLHRIMQHNILYEGDAFEKVFTKTVGLLLEDVHAFEIDTFHDSGTVGDITLESGIDMSGLVADAFMELITEYSFVDEPIPFVGSNTIEWAVDFEVENGLSIEAWTSSSDISDIDLYVFYCTPGGCEERGSSTTGTADEHVQIINPEDGTWLVGINNWSGPAGHFNLDIELTEKGAGLTISGLPSGPVPAGTPTTLTVDYDLPMELDKSYRGMVLLGPPEAPQLKEIPVTINRLAYSADVMKDVNFEMTFPGNELVYSIDLFNLGGESGDFTFSDPIPDNTSYVDASMSCMYLPAWVESFEDAWTPTGWAEFQLGDAVSGWERTTSGDSISLSPHSGSYMAWHDDEDATTGCDSWLVTPQISVPAGGGQLRFYQAVGWGTYYDHHGVLVTTDANPDPAVATYTELWSGSGTESWTEQTVDLSGYAGQDIYVAFNYVGDFAAEWYVDDVAFEQEVCPTVDYDPGLDQISYVGPLAMGTAYVPGNPEGFEDGVMPPPGWEVDNVAGPGWEIISSADESDWVHTGDYAALAYWDGNQDIWLYSSWFAVDPADSELSFWANSATVFQGTPVDGQEVVLYVIDEDGTDTPIWDMQADEVWDDSAWREVTRSLADWAGENVQLAWNYYEGAWTGYKSIFVLDDVSMPGEVLPVYEPSATVELTVLVDDPLAGGTTITNTATLAYKHDAPPETEVHEAEAYSYIGFGPVLDTSYKEGPDESTWGAEIVYHVVVDNTGDGVATLELTDPIPDGTEYAWHDNGMPYQNFIHDEVAGEMQWSGHILPGETYTFTYAVNVLEDPVIVPTTITNTATVDWEGTPIELSVYTDIRGYTYLPLIFQR